MKKLFIFLIFFNCAPLISSTALINDSINAVEKKFKAKSFEIAGIDVFQKEQFISLAAREAKELFACDEAEREKNIENFFKENALVLSSIINIRLVKNIKPGRNTSVDSIRILEKNSFFGYTVHGHVRPEEVFSAAFKYAVLKKFSSKNDVPVLNDVCKKLFDENKKLLISSRKI